VAEWREWRPITSFQRIIIKPIFSRSFEKNFYQTKNLTNPTLGSRSPKWPQGIFLNLFVLSFGYIQRRRWRHIYFLEFYFGFFLFPKPILEWDCVCVRVFFYFASVTKCVLRLIFKSLITQEEYGSPSLPNFYFGNLFTYLITLQISRLIFLKKTKFLVFAILFFFATIFLMMMTFGFSIPRRETEIKSVFGDWQSVVRRSLPPSRFVCIVFVIIYPRELRRKN
jgi:hypothetical protein